MARALTLKELGLKPPLEREVQRRVRAVYESLGCVVNVNTVYGHPKGVTPGIADLYIQHEASCQAWWHETKREGEEPSEAQEAFAERECAVRKDELAWCWGGPEQAEEMLVKRGIAERLSSGHICRMEPWK